MQRLKNQTRLRQRLANVETFATKFLAFPHGVDVLECRLQGTPARTAAHQSGLRIRYSGWGQFHKFQAPNKSLGWGILARTHHS